MQIIYHALVECGQKMKMWWPFGPSQVDNSVSDRITSVSDEDFPVQNEKSPKNTSHVATQTDEAVDAFTGNDVSTQTNRVNLTKDAWCQVGGNKPMKIQGIVTTGTVVEKARTVAESATPPSSRVVKFSTDKSVVNYTAEVSDKHLLT